MAKEPEPLVVLSSTFPYGDGEQFMADEARFWPEDRTFILVPLSSPGARRPLPSHIHVDTSLADYRTRTRLLVVLTITWLHPIFVADLRELLRSRRLGPAHVLRSYRAAAQTLMVARALRRVVRRHGSGQVYSYWNGVPAYAAALLKRRAVIRRVVSRAHGTDLYESPATTWMPLKRQFVNEFDHVWTVSDVGRRAYVQTYAPDPDRVTVSRLGVAVPKKVGIEGRDEVFRVLSISSCRPVKQVDLLVEALSQLGEDQPQRRLHWVHLGGGDGLSELRAEARTRLGSAANLHYDLRGHVEHDELHRILDSEWFDAMVNVSKSEGVPVSLMEAMARGVPVVAPRIGGIPELVLPGSGWLVPAPCSVADVALGLEEAWAQRNDTAWRDRARATIADHYSEEANYGEFMRSLAQALGGQRG